MKSYPKSPDEIANLISEDVGDNLGLETNPLTPPENQTQVLPPITLDKQVIDGLTEQGVLYATQGNAIWINGSDPWGTHGTADPTCCIRIIVDDLEKKIHWHDELNTLNEFVFSDVDEFLAFFNKLMEVGYNNLRGEDYPRIDSRTK